MLDQAPSIRRRSVRQYHPGRELTQMLQHTDILAVAMLERGLATRPPRAHLCNLERRLVDWLQHHPSRQLHQADQLLSPAAIPLVDMFQRTVAIKDQLPQPYHLKR